MNVSEKFFTRLFAGLQIAALGLIFHHAASAAGEVDPTFNPGLVQENTSAPYTTVTRFASQPDGKIIVGGYFSAIGKINSYGIARLNADGTIDATFHAPQILGHQNSNGSTDTFMINTLDVQPDGKVVFAGYFERVAGQPRLGIARLNADGSLDAAFNSNLDTALSTFPFVQDLKVSSDGKIYIVGNFSYNSGANRYIARLNADGTIDSTFNSPATINALPRPGYKVEILPSGKILYAGYSSAGNIIYRLNTDGSVDSSFTAVMLGGTVSTTGIFAIKAQADGRFYVGGAFTTYNGFPLASANLVHLNADGTLDMSFNAGGTGPNGGVMRIEILPNGQLNVGGGFTTYNGVARKFLAKLNTDGTLDNSLVFTGAGGYYDSITLTDGKFLIGGQACDNYCSFGSSPALIKLNADGSVDSTFNTRVGNIGLSNKVFVQADGKILIGGTFTHTDNQARVDISRVNADGTLDTTFNVNSPIYGSVYGIDVRASDGKILATNGDGIFRLSSNGSVDFSVATGGTYDAKFLPGGGALIAASVGLKKITETGYYDSSFFVATNAAIRKILIQPDGKFIIVGDFTQAAGAPRGRIARVNANGTLDTTFNPTGANNSIFDAVLQPDGKIIVGGNFTGINFNTNYKNLARLNSDGTLDTSFNPIVLGGVQSLKIAPNGKVLVGGGIYQVNGVPRTRIARLNADGSLDPAFDPGAGADDAVLSIDLQSNGKIIIGGAFTRVGNLDRLGVAALLDNNAPATRAQFDFDGDGKSDISLFRPSTGAWYLLQSTAGFTGVQFGLSSDKLVPADYDGDGKTDIAVFRSGTWYLQQSTLGFTGVTFGNADDIPVPADYDGDGKADLAVFRPSTGVWYLLRSQLGFTGVAFGQPADKPVAADYDGDGKADLAVFRSGTWYIQRSTLGFTGISFGAAGDTPVPADYDGDGKIDTAVFRPSTGTWYTSLNPATNYGAVLFGQAGDLPVPADYDGDGKADVAVFRPSTGSWYLNRTTSGYTAIQFGAAGDKPAPNAFIR